MSTPLTPTPLARWGNGTPRITLPSNSPWSDGATHAQKRASTALRNDDLVAHVIDLTCCIAGCARDELLSASRAVYIVQARAAAYVAIRVLSAGKVSLPSIGSAFDRDHTTVMYAIKNATLDAERMAEDVIEAYEAGWVDQPKPGRPNLRVVGE